MRVLLLWLAACSTGSTEAPAEQPPRLVGGVVEEEDPRDDTREPVEEDTDGGGLAEDTWTYLDAPIGPTALDGVWAGAFELTEVVIATENPKCFGTMTLTIDGRGPRHVIAEFSCTDWNPNISLLPGGLGREYGELFGVGFGTLNPADLSKFRIDVAMAADAMITFIADDIQVKEEAGTLIIDWEYVLGVLGIRTGHKLSATLSKGTP